MVLGVVPKMSEQITVGERVSANRDIPRKNVSKGQTGKVISIEYIDSEAYFNILMDESQEMVFTSSENCWDPVIK